MKDKKLIKRVNNILDISKNMTNSINYHINSINPDLDPNTQEEISSFFSKILITVEEETGVISDHLNHLRDTINESQQSWYHKIINNFPCCPIFCSESSEVANIITAKDDDTELSGLNHIYDIS